MATDNPFADLYGPIYGSLFFCTVLTSTFYGMTCMQAFFYYIHYQKDPWCFKVFVAIIWSINTIHEALIIAGAYKCFMAGWLNGTLSSVIAPPELVIVSIFTITSAIMTQGYFAHRLYIFTGKNINVLLVWAILAMTQLGSQLTVIVMALPDGMQSINYTTLYNHTFRIASSLYLASSAGADVLISCVLAFLLIRRRSATTYPRTVDILQRLTVFAMNTGVWPATFALLAIVLMQAFPSYMYYAVFGIPLCSLYCNTLLANLNGRSYVQGEAATCKATGNSFQSLGASVFASFKTDQPHGDIQAVPPAQGIWKTTEVVQLSDVPSFTSPENM